MFLRGITTGPMHHRIGGVLKYSVLLRTVGLGALPKPGNGRIRLVSVKPSGLPYKATELVELLQLTSQFNTMNTALFLRVQTRDTVPTSDIQ